MLNKRIYVMLLFLIVGICTISAVSATDNVTDTVTIDEADAGDVVAVDDSQNDLKGNDVKEETLAGKENDPALSQAESQDTLSGYAIGSKDYTINLEEEYKISGTNGGTISYYMYPCQAQYFNSYSFELVVYSLKGEIVHSSGKYISDTDRRIGYYTYTFNPKAITPGTYILAAIHTPDGSSMDEAFLTVSGTAVITSSDYTSTYNSGATMTARLTDKDTGLPIKYTSAKVTFSDGKTTVTKDYLTDANGRITFVPPVGAGKYTATISSNIVHISATPVKKSVTINKAAATVKAYKASGYQKNKITLKATVTSNGKNVNDGTVTFNINGKSYKASVNNGVATKQVKLSKAKTYKYTAKFSSANFVDSGAASANAVVKKQVQVKIVAKNQVIYRGAYFVQKYYTVKVQTKDGKKIKSGSLLINGEEEVKVENGKVSIPYGGYNLVYVKSVGNTHYFKKSVTLKIKFKYVPESKKYSSATKTIKYTVKYRCTNDAKTTSHTHSDGSRYIVS